MDGGSYDISDGIGRPDTGVHRRLRRTFTAPTSPPVSLASAIFRSVLHKFPSLRRSRGKDETSKRPPADLDRVGVPLTIDIVAAVKEALHDVAIRDQIRAIVLECTPKPANDVEELLDVRAAASFLSMTPAALRMAVYRGSIPCVHIGRRVRFRRSDLVRR